MECRAAGCDGETIVKDSRPARNGIRRRRCCQKCSRIFSTIELELPIAELVRGHHERSDFYMMIDKRRLSAMMRDVGEILSAKLNEMASHS